LREDKWLKPGFSSFFDAGKAPKCGFYFICKVLYIGPTGANLLGNSGSLVITTMAIDTKDDRTGPQDRFALYSFFKEVLAFL
jgi:hypothetical protein